MNLLKTLGNYLILGLTALGVIIIYGSARASEFNVYIMGTGIILLIPFVVYMIRISRGTEADPAETNLRDLKSTGMRIAVDLSKCIVISNEWTADRPKNNNTAILMNELTGNSIDNSEKADCAVSRITYTTSVNGAERTFTSPPLAKAEVTLTILLAMQKETSIYLDREDPENYYFELDFIN